LSSSYFKDKEPREFKGRVFAATVLVGAAFFILLFRFWYLQVKEHAYYKELSENNATRLIKAVAPRGIIYDRLGIKFESTDGEAFYEPLLKPLLAELKEKGVAVESEAKSLTLKKS